MRLFEELEDAEKAVQALDGLEWMGDAAQGLQVEVLRQEVSGRLAELAAQPAGAASALAFLSDEANSERPEALAAQADVKVKKERPSAAAAHGKWLKAPRSRPAASSVGRSRAAKRSPTGWLRPRSLWRWRPRCEPLTLPTRTSWCVACSGALKEYITNRCISYI